MGSLVSITQKRLEKGPHMQGPALCVRCGYEYTAVAPVGVTEMECPQCHTMKSVFKFICSPEETWTCKCGCQLFFMSRKGTICSNCGVYQYLPAD
jgi:hypothetical protein